MNGDEPCGVKTVAQEGKRWKRGREYRVHDAIGRGIQVGGEHTQREERERETEAKVLTLGKLCGRRLFTEWIKPLI